jgi:hypothetical protein
LRYLQIPSPSTPLLHHAIRLPTEHHTTTTHFTNHSTDSTHLQIPLTHLTVLSSAQATRLSVPGKIANTYSTPPLRYFPNDLAKEEDWVDYASSRGMLCAEDSEEGQEAEAEEEESEDGGGGDAEGELLLVGVRRKKGIGIRRTG